MQKTVGITFETFDHAVEPFDETINLMVRFLESIKKHSENETEESNTVVERLQTVYDGFNALSSDLEIYMKQHNIIKREFNE